MNDDELNLLREAIEAAHARGWRVYLKVSSEDALTRYDIYDPEGLRDLIAEAGAQ
jgi:hypothetical protein